MKPQQLEPLPSRREGRYLVPLKDLGSFGVMIRHGIRNSPVIFMARRHLHGLMPFGSSVHLSHQAYTEAVDKCLTQHPDVDVVSVLSLATAEWADVWVRHGEREHTPTWARKVETNEIPTS